MNPATSDRPVAVSQKKVDGNVRKPKPRTLISDVHSISI